MLFYKDLFFLKPELCTVCRKLKYGRINQENVMLSYESETMWEKELERTAPLPIFYLPQGEKCFFLAPLAIVMALCSSSVVFLNSSFKKLLLRNY